MGNVFYMRKGKTHNAPKTIRLSDVAEGGVIKVNENGVPAEFYVAKHDYESGLNGTGRTLLVRKDGYDQRQRNASNTYPYMHSAIDEWMNGEYKALLDPSVQSAIGLTSCYYTAGPGAAVSKLTRAVFLLSLTELGITDSSYNVEGSVLQISKTLKILYANGSAVGQWTRSTRFSSSSYTAGVVTNSGAANSVYPTGRYWSRPCFTMPDNAVIDEETLLIKGVY